MKFIVVLSLFLSSQFSVAEELISDAEKIKFAQRALNKYLPEIKVGPNEKKPNFITVGGSFSILPCKGKHAFGKFVSKHIATGTSECNFVKFQLYNKDTREFSDGMAVIYLDHKDRKIAGQTKLQTTPELNMVNEEAVDSQGRKINLGLHAMNFEPHAGQRPEQLFKLEVRKNDVRNPQKRGGW